MKIASFVSRYVIVVLFLGIAVLASWTAFSKVKSPKATHEVIATKEKRLPCFLVISDVHIDTSKSVTKYGSETGMDIWNSARQKLNEVIAGDKPKFIIVLGDLPWHARRDSINQLISARGNTGFVLQNLREMATATKTPFLYITGNNDSWGGDYDAFTVNGKTPFSLDNAGANQWPMINASSAGGNSPVIDDKSELQLGCYSAYPLGKEGHLKVIALNTVIFVNSNTYSANAINDATAELSWLKKQLDNAAKANDFVLMAMHVPPGKNAFKNTLHGGRGFGKQMWDATLMVNGIPAQDAFLDLIDAYKGNIIGLLGSHTHMDGLKAITNKCNGYSSFLISIPSITPDHLNNPAMKVISYDPSNNFALMNFTTYYNTLTKPGIAGWQNSYSFDSVFSCAPNMPIGGYIKTALFDKKDTASFLQNVKSIYMVKSIMPDDNDMRAATTAGYVKETCDK